MKGLYAKVDFQKKLPTTPLWIIISLLFLLTPQGGAQICDTPNGFEFGNNQYIIENVYRTYSDAMTYCRSLGGDLAVITSNEQNAFLNTFTLKTADREGNNYWIGLNDLDGNGVYTWINNSLSGYSKFRKPPTQGKCIRLRAGYDGQWEDNDCTAGQDHICQRLKDSRCFWHQFGHSFYRFVGESNTFDQAKTECTNNGGRLANISSTELNTFLTSIISPPLSSPSCYWFEISRSADSEPSTWIKGNKTSNPVSAPGEITEQTCACLWSDGYHANEHGQWDRISCLDTQPFICERPQVPTGKWTDIPGVQNVHYYESNLTTDYFSAREYCQQIGGQLAQLKSSSINSAVITKIKNRRFWIGLDDLSNEGAFRWADGTLLSNTRFNAWMNANPDNYDGYEHCVEIINSRWNDLFCSDSRRFVCEKSEAPPLHVLAMTSTPFGSSEATPRFSCILSPPDNPADTVAYTERVVVQSLTTDGYTLDVPGTKSTQTGGFIQDLPGDVTSVGVYKCSSTSTTTGSSTSADVTILSNDRHFQPTDGRLTKTIYPGDDITLSVSTMDTYTAGQDEIRWRTFSNLAEGYLFPEGDGTLTYTIRSATKRNADIYGTFQNDMVENLMYSLIRVIVSDCPRGRWNIPSCDRLCDNCYNGGICHPQSGTCICPPGFIGKNCLTACGENRFGWECELECGAGNALEACSGSQVCLPDPYGCNCLAGYSGIYCDELCTPGKFGVDCLQDCHCAGGMPCDAFSGRCEGDCEDGWSGEGCQVPPVCPADYFGTNCTEFCNCPEDSECEKDSGFCTSSGGQSPLPGTFAVGDTVGGAIGVLIFLLLLIIIIILVLRRRSATNINHGYIDATFTGSEEELPGWDTHSRYTVETSLNNERQDIDNFDLRVTATENNVSRFNETVAQQAVNVKSKVNDWDERLDELKEVEDETVEKVKEVDHKTITNAPKWSRDVSKLLNPEHDWWSLAVRLGYSEGDIRNWAPSPDPTMAFLAEWYTTHKSSDATSVVIGALKAIGRNDAAEIIKSSEKAELLVPQAPSDESVKPPYVFLSYEWYHKLEVKAIKNHLEKNGVHCWMDDCQMGGGDKLYDKINQGIRSSKVVLCIVTEKYSKSETCLKEVALAIQLKKPIIPVIIDHTQWPLESAMAVHFAELLYIQFFTKRKYVRGEKFWEDAKFSKLLRNISDHANPDQSMVYDEQHPSPTPAASTVQGASSQYHERSNERGVTDEEIVGLCKRLPHEKYSALCGILGFEYSYSQSILKKNTGNPIAAFEDILQEWKLKVGLMEDLDAALIKADLGRLVPNYKRVYDACSCDK